MTNSFSFPRPAVALSALLIAMGPGSIVATAEADLNAADRPNLLFVVLDDQAPGYVGAYGGRTPTPHLDRLAEEGVRFDAAQCVASICNPSRYTLLTGLYPGRNQRVIEETPEGEPYWVSFNADLTAEEPSIARDLKRAGYRTAYIGKWHSSFEVLRDLPDVSKLSVDNPADMDVLAERHGKLSERIRAITGFDVADRIIIGNLDNLHRKGHPLGNHNPEWQTDGAISFIRETVERDEPFFVHLAYTITHTPSNLDILEADPTVTHGGRLEEPLELHAKRETVLERMAAAGIETAEAIAAINAGSILADDQVGALVSALEALGVAENTLIIVTADHSIQGKGTAFEEGMHVPMIARWPGRFPAGTVVEDPVSFSDLVPTWLSAAGAAPRETDGVDLTPLVKGDADAHPPVFGEIGYFRSVLYDGFQYVAFRPPQAILDRIVSGELDTVLDSRRGDGIGIFSRLNLLFKPAMFEPDQLYHIETDPFQRHNLAGNPAYAERLAMMKARLAEITETFERPYPLEVPPEMLTKAYADAVINRKAALEDRIYYPQDYDADRIFNLNLRDPLQ